MNSANDPLLEEYTYDSLFGPAEVFCLQNDDGDPLRVLYVDGGFQSATYVDERRFETPFAYCQCFNRVFDLRPDARRGLMVGGGAFSFPKAALTQRPDLHMDVVEIDPVIVDVARRHFYVDELEKRVGDRLSVFVEDGSDFLAKAPDDTYDFLINDSFAGTVVDSPLLTARMLSEAKRCLAKGGVYLLNVVSEDEFGDEDAHTFDVVKYQLKGTFAHVKEFICDDGDYAGSVNRVYFASDGPVR